jgi:hypothetical protein
VITRIVARPVIRDKFAELIAWKLPALAAMIQILAQATLDEEAVSMLLRYAPPAFAGVIRALAAVVSAEARLRVLQLFLRL